MEEIMMGEELCNGYPNQVIYFKMELFMVLYFRKILTDMVSGRKLSEKNINKSIFNLQVDS